VSDKELLAGNLRLSFPESRVEVARTPAELEVLVGRIPSGKVLFVSEGEAETGWFREHVRQFEGGGSIFRRSESPLLYVPDKMFRIHWLMISHPSVRKNP